MTNHRLLLLSNQAAQPGQSQAGRCVLDHGGRAVAVAAERGLGGGWGRERRDRHASSSHQRSHVKLAFQSPRQRQGRPSLHLNAAERPTLVATLPLAVSIFHFLLARLS